jgi:bifunctional enzyme CysN/CysC
LRVPHGSGRRQLLRFMTAGSVDDGKSTLVGRLLYDAKGILEDQWESVERASVARGLREVDLAFLTDGLRAEREQGITIDVAYRYFATPKRAFVIADTPGHYQYTRNMATGASTADLAVILLDARKGLVEQGRRHAFIASLLGIPHVIVCVNKMDLVGWEQGVFDAVRAEFSRFAARLAVSHVSFIPVSALHGDNVVERSPNMDWYDGRPLLGELEEVYIGSDRNLVDFRLPVQTVIRPRTGAHRDYRGYAGQLASGVIRVGDEVVALPSGLRTTVTSVEAPCGPVPEAFAPMSVVVRVADDLDISRGDLLARPNNRPEVGCDLEAVVCWLDRSTLAPGTRWRLKHTTRTTQALVQEVRYRFDVTSLHREHAVDRLTLNEIGRVCLRTAAPLVFDPYSRNRTTGGFILIDEASNATAGAGMIIGPGR